MSRRTREELYALVKPGEEERFGDLLTAIEADEAKNAALSARVRELEHLQSLKAPDYLQETLKTRVRELEGALTDLVGAAENFELPKEAELKAAQAALAPKPAEACTCGGYDIGIGKVVHEEGCPACNGTGRMG